MQEGSFRCDANVSVRPYGQKEFGTRAEVKNINSFRFVENAINFEVERQIDRLENGEEIIQETMTIIWTKADYYDPKVASPSTWIYTIARNKKIDILRKSRKAILEDIDTAILPPVESKADENIEHDQKFEMIAQYLDDLPEDQLNLLKMNFFEEKSHGEISEITKIPLGTVKSRIRLALEKIRGKLEQDGTMANLNEGNKSSIN